MPRGLQCVQVIQGIPHVHLHVAALEPLEHDLQTCVCIYYDHIGFSGACRWRRCTKDNAGEARVELDDHDVAAGHAHS